MLLSAPRRVGKSSLVIRLCQDLKQRGRTVVQTDVQDVSDEVGFVRALLQAIQDAGIKLPRSLRIAELCRGLREALKGSKAKAVGVEVEMGADEMAVWQKIGDALKWVLGDAGKKGRVLIAMDELRVFLSWKRRHA